MRSYIHVIFIFQLLALGNYILFYTSSGYDQIVPVLIGVVLIPLIVIMTLIQFVVESKHPNQTMVMKHITKGLTIVVVLWAIIIVNSDGF